MASGGVEVVDDGEVETVCLCRIDRLVQAARADRLYMGQFGFAATGSGAVLQPYCSVYKASGTGVGTLAIDVIQASADRV